MNSQWYCWRKFVQSCWQSPRKFILLGLLSLGIAIAPLPAQALDPSAPSHSSHSHFQLQTSTPNPQPPTPSSTTPLAQGRSLYAAGQFTAAITVWQQALQSYERQGDRLNQALSLSYLSLAYQELND